MPTKRKRGASIKASTVRQMKAMESKRKASARCREKKRLREMEDWNESVVVPGSKSRETIDKCIQEFEDRCLKQVINTVLVAIVMLHDLD